MKLELVIEMVVGLFLIIALALHLAAVGIIGLGVIILLTSFKGITDEHDLGDAFKEALPFTALLVVFFAVVSVIADQGLFSPIIAYVLAQNLDAAVHSKEGLPLDRSACITRLWRNAGFPII